MVGFSGGMGGMMGKDLAIKEKRRIRGNICL